MRGTHARRRGAVRLLPPLLLKIKRVHCAAVAPLRRLISAVSAHCLYPLADCVSSGSQEERAAKLRNTVGKAEFIENIRRAKLSFSRRCWDSQGAELLPC